MYMTEDEFENPTPKKGETKKDFIQRCIPIVKKEHPSWSDKKVKAVCYDIYERKHNYDHMIANGYQLFTDSADFEIIKTTEEIESKNAEAPTTVNNTRRIVAIYGDRFMNGGFVSESELKKCYKQWEGTLHDINHMGTSTGFFLMQQDITYFIGYHNNVKYDKTNKSVSMDLNVHMKTAFAEAWEAYVELCEMAGQIPNVSVTYYGKQDWISFENLPANVKEKAKAEGYGKDDLVPVLNNIVPVCVSTVLRGRCNDKDGCGIRDTNSCGSDSDSCDCVKDKKDTKLDEEIEKKRQELIAYLKENSETED